MLLSLNLLKKYIDLPQGVTPQEIGEKLTMATVEVESVSGHGTVFHILFPLVRDDQETES